MSLDGRPPEQKPEKVEPDPAYLVAVRELPCCACGRHGPSEAHHCRDMPPKSEQGLYTRLPAGARKSGDRDAIPLCLECHWIFHNRRSEFQTLYGVDYGFIPPTRANLSDMELDF